MERQAVVHERLSNGRFAAKREKTGGRKKGTPNKVTKAAKE